MLNDRKFRIGFCLSFLLIVLACVIINILPDKENNPLATIVIILLFIGFIIYILLLWHRMKKTMQALQSHIPTYYGGKSSYGSHNDDEEEQGDGIDNPSDRRDVSDD